MGEYHIDETIRLYLLRVLGFTSGTMVTTTGAQTLADKTLTAPVINGTVDTGTGMVLGTNAADLVAFHGSAAVDQAAAIADAAGGATVDAEARTALNLVLAALREKGLIAT